MKEDIINGAVTCCGKAGYVSEKRCKTALNTIKKHKETAKTKLPSRVYRCENGWWHMTSLKVK